MNQDCSMFGPLPANRHVGRPSCFRPSLNSHLHTSCKELKLHSFKREESGHYDVEVISCYNLTHREATFPKKKKKHEFSASNRHKHLQPHPKQSHESDWKWNSSINMQRPDVTWDLLKSQAIPDVPSYEAHSTLKKLRLWHSRPLSTCKHASLCWIIRWYRIWPHFLSLCCHLVER